MEKVKVPQEVAKAIEILLENGYTAWYYVEHCEVQLDDHSDLDEALQILRDFIDFGEDEKRKDLILNSMLNGFEIFNPEEEVISEYEHSLFLYKKYKDETDEIKKFIKDSNQGKMQGILRTLDIYGIKIKGLNN